MPSIRGEIRSGVYYDSAVLMQLQRGLLGLPGVLDSGVVMGTPANRELLAQSGLLMAEFGQAGPNDLLIVVKAQSDSAASAALSQVNALLTRRPSVSSTFHPKSLETAVRQLPAAQWVLISVPGRFAARVAHEALALNRHVFLYSDNVSLQDEIELKKAAQMKGLLMMGPDCGTAIINGIGLGFANRVRRGGIGLVGASGTGLQVVSSRIHALGAGISQAIGTGGRDLQAEVGALTARQALAALSLDPETRVLVLVSKPPSAEVATQLLASARAVGKPVIVNFIGYPPPARKLGNLLFATSLSEAADMAVGELAAEGTRSWPAERPIQGYVRGLFSGGTLAYEAMLGLQTLLFPLYSNAFIHESQKLADPLRSRANTIVDLGDDIFMVGRLHPMIDNDLRLRRLRQEAADPEVGLILLDVVLGGGAHPDPMRELAPAIAEVKAARSLEVVILLIGTDEDPQEIEKQRKGFQGVGAVVFRSGEETTDYLVRRMGFGPISAGVPIAPETWKQPLAAINVGLESFYHEVLEQGACAVHVDWRPPAGGDEKLAAILAKMKKK